ncbi:Nitroalkane oxidase [Fusarium oxysporum f. sp. cubense]|uniref:Nitroalkane oxidase n=1 Tax=Fusarium oxysporum f. sp. cubense TaxID=61366 RepID=A0A559LFB8_FUSOC|nr:Nitroalkane oxidase [Fusarium oxysporum f. sp. cubense]
MVDFKLSPSQLEARRHAQAFANTVLTKASAEYSTQKDQLSRFQATRPFYREAVRHGLIKAQVPIPLGGTMESLVHESIILEELFAVEPATSITIVATALGLMPVILCDSPSLQEKFLKPFISGEGEPLASLMHSEPNGTANWLQKGGPGLQTTARKVGNEWIINGEKLWPSNSGGWDYKGADLACVVCRVSDDPSKPQDPDVDPATQIAVLLVTRETIANNKKDAYQILGEPELAGHITTSGPHTRFTEFRVPHENLLCTPGLKAQGLVETAFAMSAALVGAMAIGTARAAFEEALAFAKSDTRGGSKHIIEHQSVADKLIDCKIRLETSRLLVWKAVTTLEDEALEWKVKLEMAMQTKIYTTDVAVECVIDAMKAVGMKSYAKDMSFPRLLNEVMCYPLFDGGNIGLRRRQMQRVMALEDYEPWAATYGSSKVDKSRL